MTRPMRVGTVTANDAGERERAMAKAAKETAPTTMDFELAEERSGDLEDFTVNFVTIRRDHDLAPMLAVLPGGVCRCPHWGLVAKGRLIARYGDREEVFDAGDAYYMPPGHTAAATAGTEFVQFSPRELLAQTEAAIARGMQEAAGG